MIRKISLPIILIALSIGFWYSQNFELVAVGVAVLLLGIHTLESGFSSAAAGKLKLILEKMGGNFTKGFGLGFTSTVVFQSSSLITIIAISFISAGLLSLTSGLGIVFGSNLGTTATSWLIALFGLKLKLSLLAAPMIVFGVLLSFQKKSPGLVSLGQIILGLGFFFTGIFIMQQGFEDYQKGITLDSISGDGILREVIFFVLGIALTMILQSSSATMAIVLTALYSGQISYPDGIGLAVGANVGTTITAIVGASVANAAGKQVALGHFIFNMVTAIIALVFIQPMMAATDYLANAMNIPNEEYTLKLALFHTLFNVVGIIIMLPFVQILARLLLKLVPEKASKVVQPKHLNEAILEFPQAARIAIFEESQDLFKTVKDILLSGIGLKEDQMVSQESIRQSVDNKKQIKKLDIEELYEINIKPIYGKIIKFGSNQGDYSFFEEIKTINRRMISIIKELELLHENLCTHSLSKDELILREYNQMRLAIAFCIFESDKVGAAEDLKEFKKELKVLRSRVKAHEKNIANNMPIWIHEDLISSRDASSLLNDSHYAVGICKNINRVTQDLYKSQFIEESDVETEDEEMEEFVLEE